MGKPKLSVLQQIERMKNSGIQFVIVTEDEAADFLTDHTYYFKIKAYAKNYSKYNKGDNAGKYSSLDFAYLKELSTIDSLIRKEIIKITLDIEHFLKVSLLKDFNSNQNEDGYEIVKAFLDSDPDLIFRISNKGRNSSTCSDLVEKFKNEFALWNIIEVLSFGDFIKLYKCYFSTYYSRCNYENELFSVKCIRNAAAHNNCLINSLAVLPSQKFTPNRNVVNFVSRIPEIHKKSIDKRMNTPSIHDFITMLYVFDRVVTSEKTKFYTMKGLKELFDVRMVKHRDYFSDNYLLKSCYEFVHTVIDYLSQSEYNKQCRTKTNTD